jgi:hypothetical protein
MLDALPESDDWLVILDAESGGGELVTGAEIVVVLDWIEDIRRLVPPL